ncbi:MAG: hypothetical protein OHK0039_47340 [Bacteroidia bacterium]
MRTVLSLFLLVLSCHLLHGQASIRDSAISLGLIDVSYRGLWPGSDMNVRFGYLSQVGLDLSYKFRNNFYFNAGAHVLFTDSVAYRDILAPILTTGDLVVSDNGLLTSVRVIGNGFVVPFAVGRVFAFAPGPNPNSGLFVEVGGQFIQHKLSFNPREDDVQALTGAYAKGYDRLTNGWGLRQSLGYRYLSNRGDFNMVLAVDLSQHFTRSRRSIDFSTGLRDTQQRRDLLTGFRVSWTFPIYQRAPRSAYFY